MSKETKKTPTKESKKPKTGPKISTGERITKFSNRVTDQSTSLLMIAVIFYFITLLLAVLTVNDPSTGNPVFSVFTDMAGLFAVINALLWAFVRLFAGLSFAAVCFDESKNIWFRVVSVAALTMILFGGLAIF
jgi:hypothetical protein